MYGNEIGGAEMVTSKRRDPKFELCHSMNGRIRMKKASGHFDKEGNNNRVGDWISVSSPNDLFKHGENNIDFGKVNYYPLLFNDKNNSDEEWLRLLFFVFVICLVF